MASRRAVLGSRKRPVGAPQPAPRRLQWFHPLPLLHHGPVGVSDDRQGAHSKVDPDRYRVARPALLGQRPAVRVEVGGQPGHRRPPPSPPVRHRDRQDTKTALGDHAGDPPRVLRQADAPQPGQHDPAPVTAHPRRHPIRRGRLPQPKRRGRRCLRLNAGNLTGAPPSRRARLNARNPAAKSSSASSRTYFDWPASHGALVGHHRLNTGIKLLRVHGTPVVACTPAAASAARWSNAALTISRPWLN